MERTATAFDSISRCRLGVHSLRAPGRGGEYRDHKRRKRLHPHVGSLNETYQPLLIVNWNAEPERALLTKRLAATWIDQLNIADGEPSSRLFSVAPRLLSSQGPDGVDEPLAAVLAPGMDALILRSSLTQRKSHSRRGRF